MSVHSNKLEFENYKNSTHSDAIMSECSDQFPQIKYLLFYSLFNYASIGKYSYTLIHSVKKSAKQMKKILINYTKAGYAS